MRRRAALLPALALALLPLQAGAQEKLPSVSDYHLPTPSPKATRAAGPVDPVNPVVPVKREESSDAPATPASATPSAAAAHAGKSAPKAAPKPTPSSSASPSPARPADPRRAEEPRERNRSEEPARAETSESRPSESSAPVEAAASPSATSLPITLPVQWHVHSARDDQGPIWPWLLGIAALLATNAYLLVQLLRRRQRDAVARIAWHPDEAAEELPAADRIEPAMAEPVSRQPAPEPAMPAPRPAAHPKAPIAIPQPAMAKEPLPPKPAPEQRPALELVAKPIEVTLAARQLSATLMNAVLNYELVVTNLSDDNVGPILIAGDMIGAHASLPTRSQLEIAGNDMEPHHRHPVLHPNEWAKFVGEFRLPLAAITPIQSGRASLFIPLARFRVEVMRNGAPPLVINRTFVIGETPETPEAALKPFRLDLGPRLYSQIGQREVAATA